MKRITSIILTVAMLISLVVSIPTEFNVEAASAPTVSYMVHRQTYGDSAWTTNGGSAGTVGESKRLEAIKIQVSGVSNLGVTYRVHAQTYGWRNWVSDGSLSGTHGEAKRLEAIQIKLTGTNAANYDIYYKVHAQTYGWLDWAKNGESSGTAGQGKRLEAIQIKIVAKGSTAPGNTSYKFVDYAKTTSNTSSTAGMVNYFTHVQTYGNQKWVSDGSLSGTYGEAKRLEQISIKLGNTGYTGGITYRTQVQTYGWLNWVSDGAASGTSGQSKRLEAIEIKLTGNVADKYDVYYRVHAQTYGWLGWAKNGESAGTEGLSKRLEAIQIVLLPKGSSAPLGSGTAFKCNSNNNNSNNNSNDNSDKIIRPDTTSNRAIDSKSTNYTLNKDGSITTSQGVTIPASNVCRVYHLTDEQLLECYGVSQKLITYYHKTYKQADIKQMNGIDFFANVPEDCTLVVYPNGLSSQQIQSYAVDLLNDIRDQEGLEHFNINTKVTQLANLRAVELSTYYSHSRNGKIGTYTDLLDFGYYGNVDNTLYVSGGSYENIARGQSSIDEAIYSWYSSDGHRRVLLLEDGWNEYSVDIGIGWYETPNGYDYWSLNGECRVISNN